MALLEITTFCGDRFYLSKSVATKKSWDAIVLHVELKFFLEKTAIFDDDGNIIITSSIANMRLVDSRESHSQALKPDEVCEACGQIYVGKTKRTPKIGYKWNGYLSQFSSNGICPKCYYELAIKSSMEFQWDEQEWCKYIENEISHTDDANKLQQLLTIYGSKFPTVKQLAEQKICSIENAMASDSRREALLKTINSVTNLKLLLNILPREFANDKDIFNACKTAINLILSRTESKTDLQEMQAFCHTNRLTDELLVVQTKLAKLANQERMETEANILFEKISTLSSKNGNEAKAICQTIITKYPNFSKIEIVRSHLRKLVLG